jgi:hypothetical protein
VGRNSAVNLLVELFSDRPVGEFDAMQFTRLRAELIQRKYSRKYSNELIGWVKRCFKWAMQRRYISADQFVSIESIDRLTAREAKTP